MERVCKKIFCCAECKKEFEGRGSLHKHLKQHGLSLAEYYTLHYPRENQLTGEPLPFKKYEEYLQKLRDSLKKYGIAPEELDKFGPDEIPMLVRERTTEMPEDLIALIVRGDARSSI